MQPSRARLRCRSHNPFTPAIALWQHFIPSRPFPNQQRLSSSATQLVGSSNAPPVESHDALSPHVESLAPKRSQDCGMNGNLVLRKMEVGRKPAHDPRQLMLSTKHTFDETEDYAGIVVQPMQTKKRTKDPELPWYLHRGEQNTNGLDRLSREITKFYEYAKPSRSEALARRNLVEQVRSHAKEVLPKDVLEVFGSERTGLSLATSDIDLRLTTHRDAENPKSAPRPPTKHDRRRLLEKLYRLHKKLEKRDEYLLCTIRHARYPLISLQDRESGLDVQIVLSNDTSVARGIMTGYMQEYPYLRELYSVVKTMFDVRGLSDVFRGGFGSYSIFMMIVASLRHRPPPRQDPADGLISFLKFWGHFDTSANGVSIEPTSLFNKDEEFVISEKAKEKLLNKDAKPPRFLLTLRDPADPTNDLGRKGICIKHVQRTCRHLYEYLNSNRGDDCTIRMHLKEVVGPIYDLHRERRKKLGNQGQNILIKVQGSLAAKAKKIRQAERSPRRAGTATSGASVSELPEALSTPHEHGDMITSLFGMPSAEELVAHQTQEDQQSTSSEVVSAAVSDVPQDHHSRGEEPTLVGEQSRPEKHNKRSPFQSEQAERVRLCTDSKAGVMFRA